MTEEKTEVPSSGSPVQEKSTAPPPSPDVQDTGVPASGRRTAFRDVRRQLVDEEFSSTGVQRLLLDMLEEADEERESLRGFVDQYHEADKQAAILMEKLRTQKSIELFFGVGITLGGTIIGLAPFLWGAKPEYGVVTGIVGLCLLLGAVAGRMVKK